MAVVPLLLLELVLELLLQTLQTHAVTTWTLDTLLHIHREHMHMFVMEVGEM